MHFEALIGPCCGDAILMWVGFGFEITKMKDMIELFVKVCQIED
jgi:hypothetical protein